MTGHFEQYPQEKRRSPRITGTGIEVEYFTSTKKETLLKATVKDLCIHGICLYLKDVLQATETITMKIFLPKDETPIGARGTFVWYAASKYRNLFKVGIEFEEIAKEDQKKITDYIEAHSKK